MSPSHSVAANSAAMYSYTPTAVSGYTPIGVVGTQNTGAGNALLTSAFIEGGKIYTLTKNFTGSQQNVTDHIRVLYVRSGVAG